MWSAIVQQAGLLISHLSSSIHASSPGAINHREPYTGPFTNGGRAWAEAYSQAVAAVANMTLAEKVRNLTWGVITDHRSI